MLIAIVKLLTGEDFLSHVSRAYLCLIHFVDFEKKYNFYTNTSCKVEIAGSFSKFIYLNSVISTATINCLTKKLSHLDTNQCVIDKCDQFINNQLFNFTKILNYAILA